MKKILRSLALSVAIVTGLAASLFSTGAHAQFNPSNGFQTFNNACGTYFLQGTTYYNYQGTSLGTTLPYCPASLSVQQSNALQVIPAKFTNATLPACNSSSAGLILIQTDSAASPVYAATATGGGTLYVEVMCTNSNGTFNWTNH